MMVNVFQQVPSYLLALIDEPPARNRTAKGYVEDCLGLVIICVVFPS